MISPEITDQKKSLKQQLQNKALPLFLWGVEGGHLHSRSKSDISLSMKSQSYILGDDRNEKSYGFGHPLC